MEGSRVLRGLVIAALPLLLASKCFLGYSSDDSLPPPSPPPDAYVSIDSPPEIVDTSTVTLGGEAECPGCFASDWEYQRCPVIQCPDGTGLEVSWVNHANGATGAAQHAIAPACHCPIFSSGYCYTACNHVWWATMPLAYGDNAIEVFATAPGYDRGSRLATIERVPVPPTWLPAQVGPGTVTLDWSAVPGATSYNLYWSTTPYGYSSLMTQIAGVTAPYLHAGLASGVPHYYYLTALAGEAESFDSIRLTATPD